LAREGAALLLPSPFLFESGVSAPSNCVPCVQATELRVEAACRLQMRFTQRACAWRVTARDRAVLNFALTAGQLPGRMYSRPRAI